MEAEMVSGIAYSRDEAKVTLLSVNDVPGVATKLFAPLAKAGVNVDMIVQNVSPDGAHTDMTFTVGRADLDRAVEVIKKDVDLEYKDLLTAANVSKISVVGVGMQSHFGVANTMFSTLADKNINIQVISTSEIKISILIEEDYTELAVRALHAAYGLEEAKAS